MCSLRRFATRGWKSPQILIGIRLRLAGSPVSMIRREIRWNFGSHLPSKCRIGFAPVSGTLPAVNPAPAVLRAFPLRSSQSSPASIRSKCARTGTRHRVVRSAHHTAMATFSSQRSSHLLPTRRPALVDVHPSHGPIHSWRDFFIHLATITIGLLIALGLEGYVEWVHHRHLLHEAESSLREEIRGNASKMGETIARLHQSQQELKDDLTILSYVIKNRKWPESANFSIKFDITRFDNVSWD